MKSPGGKTVSSSKVASGKPPASCPPVYFPAKVTPRGDGSYIVEPLRPVVGEHWVEVKEAMKVLGLTSRGTLHNLRNSPGLCEMIRWKYTTPKQGKIVYEVNSLWAYRRAMEDCGK